MVIADSSSNPMDLMAYVKTPVVPPEVESLVEKGRSNYANGFITAAQWKTYTKETGGWELSSAGAGRTGDWVHKTYGKDEKTICEDLAKISGPKSVTIGDISKAFEKPAKSVSSGIKSPKFTIVQGVGANDLHRTPLGNNAVYQIASQFNYLESMSTTVVPVGAYLSDKTQGPQASIEASAAALHRKAAVDANKLNHALTGLLPEKLLKKYPNLYLNGYLNITVLTEGKQKKLLAFMEANKAQLGVLPQWAICESSGATQLQVFCAAPSFQGSAMPGTNTTAHKICKLLVIEQYAATARLAVLRSRATGEKVPLHLTLVGQGAFNNNPAVMQEAIEAVAKIVQGEGVDVYFHAYKLEAQSILETQMSSGAKKGLFTISKMSVEDFKKQPHPAADIAAAPKAPSSESAGHEKPENAGTAQFEENRKRQAQEAQAIIEKTAGQLIKESYYTPSFLSTKKQTRAAETQLLKMVAELQKSNALSPLAKIIIEERVLIAIQMDLRTESRVFDTKSTFAQKVKEMLSEVKKSKDSLKALGPDNIEQEAKEEADSELKRLAAEPAPASIQKMDKRIMKKYTDILQDAATPKADEEYKNKIRRDPNI